jgi:hypothetical protein
MSTTAPSAVTNPPAAESAVSPAPGAVAGARQRVASLLASGSAGLRSFDRRLEALARRDWSVSSFAKNVERKAQDASSVLQRRARARLRQLDHLPVEALAATVERSRSAVKTLTSSLEKAASRVGGAKPSA